MSEVRVDGHKCVITFLLLYFSKMVYDLCLVEITCNRDGESLHVVILYLKLKFLGE